MRFYLFDGTFTITEYYYDKICLLFFFKGYTHLLSWKARHVPELYKRLCIFIGRLQNTQLHYHCLSKSECVSLPFITLKTSQVGALPASIQDNLYVREKSIFQFIISEYNRSQDKHTYMDVTSYY